MPARPKPSFNTVDEYIALQPEHVRAGLEQIRKTIKKVVPKADEVISYGMPGYKFHGMLVWFAAARNHYGLYAMANSVKVFKDKLKKYDCSKGTIRFPIDKPLPLDLIAEIIKFRMEENLEKALLKELAKSKRIMK
jgi:uncharacterized protein YdhG (YjbR/CyaY superfamily)